jgi:hypothetical protein
MTPHMNRLKKAAGYEVLPLCQTAKKLVTVIISAHVHSSPRFNK